MLRKVYINHEDQQIHAFLRWQGNDISVYGLKEGYIKGADNLVTIALNEGANGSFSSLDTYIYPIVTLYIQAIEISLIQIYLRFFQEPPKEGNNLITTWSILENKIIDTITSTEFMQRFNENKKTFMLYTLSTIDFESIHHRILDMQNIYYKIDMWKYYLGKSGVSYFTENEYINYIDLKNLAKEIYDVLEYILLLATIPLEEVV